jgi:DNA gyrase subunit B
MEGLKFARLTGKQSYTGAQFRDILNATVDLQRIVDIMSKRGVMFADYIKKYDKKTKKMPLYVVKVEGNTHYVYDDKELAKATEKDEDAQYTEIFERDDLANIEKKLNKLGLSAADFFKDDADETPATGAKATKTTTRKTPVLKPRFVIEDEKDKHELFSLQDVLEFVRVQAQKGVHIQRYKGLGEMNPQQLWDTTMDPEHRTILKVTLEDEVEAEGIFSILMGDEVAPRREFIETFAHEVKELDV